MCHDLHIPLWNYNWPPLQCTECHVLTLTPMIGCGGIRNATSRSFEQSQRSNDTGRPHRWSSVLAPTYSWCMGVAGPQKDFSTANTPCVPSIHWQAKNLSFVIVSRRLLCFLLQCVLKFILFKINLQWGQQNLFCSLDALVAVEHSAGANGCWAGATGCWAGATGSWAGATKCYEGAAACTSSWCICRCLTNCNRFLSVAAQ